MSKNGKQTDNHKKKSDGSSGQGYRINSTAGQEQPQEVIADQQPRSEAGKAQAVIGQKQPKAAAAGTAGGFRRICSAVDRGVIWLDGKSLWWLGFILLAGIFTPFLLLGEKSVFEIHDQLDETLMTYILNARYLFTGTKVYPEMLGGVNASGMQPSAVLFIPLYRILPAFAAFVLQYMIVCASGFFGMYLCVRKLTESSILALMTAGIFCMLPIQPVYGLSVLGAPLLIYGFLCLYHREKRMLSFVLIAFFGLTTHLVLIGYVVLTFWGLAVLAMLFTKKINGWLCGGFAFLTGIYVAVNHSLFVELLLGQGGYVSHREELVNYGTPFWQNVKDVLMNSAQHVPVYHNYLIVPIIAFLLSCILYYPRLSAWGKRTLKLSIGILVTIFLIAVIYGACKSQPVADWKNSMSGFFRYFQLERYYWLYSTLWYLEAALLLGIFWREKIKWFPQTLKLLLICAILLPTVLLVKKASILYRNVNQMNNGSEITGYISWEGYYAEDLMEELDAFIGRDKSSYRVAHLGISPAPSLLHGFYTIDGYSNNYPLEYKHAFRRIIEKELDKNYLTKAYFDEWGSRCYLFNSESGNYWLVAKDSGFRYQDIQLNVEQMIQLGCEYLFSGGEILNAEELGLKPLGYFETEESYWGIWLYGLP